MKIIKKVKKFLIGGENDNSTPKIVSEELNDNPTKGAKLFLKTWYDNDTSRKILEEVNADIKSKTPEESNINKQISESLDDRLQKANETKVYRIEHKENEDGTVTMAPKGLQDLGRRGLIGDVRGRGFVYPELTDEQGNSISAEEKDYRWRKALADFYNSEGSTIGGVYNPLAKEVYMPKYNSYIVNPITHEVEHAYNDFVPETMYSTQNIDYKLKEGVAQDSKRDSPTERVARLMQLRQALQLNPDKRDYTDKDVSKMLKELGPGQLKDDLNRIEEQSIANMLNYIAQNANQNQNDNNSNFNRFSKDENQRVLTARLGMIKIKPENKGKFTEKANKRGLGVQEFANKVLNNKENYNTSTIKQANFAKNANKWNKKKLGWNSNNSSTGKQNKSVNKFKDGGVSYLEYNPGIIGEGINALGNIGGSIASYFTNKKFLDKMEEPKEPLMLQHNKRITKVNVNPQLREIKNSADRLKKSVVDNTASASKILKVLREIESSKTDKLVDIYSQKENMENALINQDIAARSEVDKYNLEQANKYRESVRDFYNKKYDLQSENTQGLISGLTDSVSSIISEIGKNRAQRDGEKMILAKSDISAEEAKAKGLSVAPAWDIQMQQKREERKQRRAQRKNKDYNEE